MVPYGKGKVEIEIEVKGEGKGGGRGRGTSKGKGKVQGKEAKSDKQGRVRKERALRTTLLVASKPRHNNERGGRRKGELRRSKEVVFTIDNIVTDIRLIQSRCESHGDGLVMTDSEASDNVCPNGFGESD